MSKKKRKSGKPAHKTPSNESGSGGSKAHVKPVDKPADKSAPSPPQPTTNRWIAFAFSAGIYVTWLAVLAWIAMG